MSVRRPENIELKSSLQGSSVTAETIAIKVIHKLDKDFSRDDVRLIAEWVNYLSTQN